MVDLPAAERPTASVPTALCICGPSPERRNGRQGPPRPSRHRISAARARQIPSNLPSAVNLLRCRLRLGAKREATSGKPKPLCDSAFLLTTPAVQPTLLVDKNILFP